jgi:1-acyl-sn-glycerol-3-phosphate acyltransferase
LTEFVDEQPGVLARFVRWVLERPYHWGNWKTVGTCPEPRKFVLIAAPHTSNWDFVNFLGLTTALGIRPFFMGKLSLFRWPLAKFMRQMGGIPVDRRTSHDMVQQMVDEFARRSEFILTVAPEGTRSKTKKWKTGFYQIALAAKVPLVVGMMDYGRRTGGLGPTIWPTGDFRADMEKVLDVYRGCIPKIPDRAVTSIDDIVGDAG